MDEQPAPTLRSRRPSGRDAKRAARTARSHSSVPFITRSIPYYEVLGAEGLELLEHNADTILQEIGIDFRDDPETLKILRDAGADVQGERARRLGGDALIGPAEPRGTRDALRVPLARS